MCNNFFFRKSCHLWDNVGKHSSAHAHCMLDTTGYIHTHTHTVCNTAFTPQRLLRTLSVLFLLLLWCFYCNGSLCHTYRTNALEVLIYTARLSLFRLIAVPHYCILPKDISIPERLIRPIVLRCMVVVLFPPHSFGRPSYCIIGSNNFNKSKLTSFHTVFYANRSVGTVRPNC
jgi:hypothetical protein